MNFSIIYLVLFNNKTSNDERISKCWPNSMYGGECEFQDGYGCKFQDVLLSGKKQNLR